MEVNVFSLILLSLRGGKSSAVTGVFVQECVC